MEEVFVSGRAASAYSNQIVDDMGCAPRAARDVAAGEPWLFFEHRTLAEVFAEEQRSQRPMCKRRSSLKLKASITKNA